MFRKEKPELLEPLGLTTAAGPALSTSQPMLEKKEALKVIESSKNNDTSSSARPGF